MREMTQAQQTTIKLLLTLAVYHAQNVKVMNELLDELNKAKGTHTRLASHLEFLYEQVEFIKEMQRTKQKPKKRYIRIVLILIVVIIALLFYAKNL